MHYKLTIERPVARYLQTLDQKTLKAVWKKINALIIDPRPVGSIKLKGRDAYRVRAGNYRIIYEIRDNVLTVILTRVGHRRDVYE